jgi:hypothetical protein
MSRVLLRLAVCFGLLLWTPVVVAQVEEGPGPPAEGTEEDLMGEELDVTSIEQILRGEERVFEGEIFSYDPAGRRDPFHSLLDGVEVEDRQGPRPDGLPGTLIEELKVGGVIETASGILAFAQGRENVSYILRPGTKLFNGEVQEIYLDRVVFKQQINDPKSLKPYREVVREIVAD